MKVKNIGPGDSREVMMGGLKWTDLSTPFCPRQVTMQRQILVLQGAGE